MQHLRSRVGRSEVLVLPPEQRERLRTLAQAAKTPDAVYARELLVEALASAECAVFRKRLEASRTPERRARDRVIAAALERLHGEAVDHVLRTVLQL